MAIIRVPKTPRTAYDPERPAGALLQAQIKHLEWATRPAAERNRDRFEVVAAATEAEASSRIEALTVKLHAQTLGREPIAAAVPTKPRRRGAARRRPAKAKPNRRRTR